MKYCIEELLRAAFVSGSEISVFDLICSCFVHIAKREFWEIVCTPLFGGRVEDHDDEEGHGSILYSRFGKPAGSYYYWCKKVNRGEATETDTSLDVPLLGITFKGDGEEWDDEWLLSHYGQKGLDEYKLIESILRGKFLTMRGIITLARAFIPDVDGEEYITVSDEYDPADDDVLKAVVEQDPPEGKPDNNPKTRAECRKSGLFKALANGLSSVNQSDIIAYSTLTGVFAAGDPAFLYIDESLKGRDLPDFIRVSYGNPPTGGVGLGDGGSVYRCRMFDGITSQCLKHISYYDRLPENNSHWLPKVNTPPMVGC